MNKKIKFIIAIITSVIYLYSLFNECYLVNGRATIGSYGLIAFLFGWLNFNSIGIIWLANPLFIFSLTGMFTGKNEKLLLLTSSIALFLALCFMCVDTIIINEAGGKGSINQYLKGYWIWLISMSLLFLKNILNFFILLKQKNQ